MNGAIAEKLLPPVFDASLGGLMVTFFSSPAAQLKEAGISERGIQAVEFALKNGCITNTDVQEMVKVSKPTATRLLTSLSDYLELKGATGKGTYYTIKGLTKGSRQHCFVLLNTLTCLEGNPHVHRPCGIRRFHSPSDSQIYYREHQTSSDSLYSGIHIVMILICLLFGVLIYLQIVWRKKPNEKRHTALAICSILIET